MRIRALTVLVSFGTVAGGASAPAALQAQRPLAELAPDTRAGQLESLSRQRVLRWAATAPTIRCAPAPLTERPTAGAEFARPRVVPLEAAFLDAFIVKRTFAARVGRVRAN
jgi:hypothetical protein